MMVRTTTRIAVLAVALTGAAALPAQDPQKRITPAEVPWPAGGVTGPLVGSSGVTGIQTVTLKGDPTKPGLYTILLRVGPTRTPTTASQPWCRETGILGTARTSTKRR